MGSPTFVQSYLEGAQLVADKKCKYFFVLGSTAIHFGTGRFCGTLQTTGSPFFTSGLHFLLPKGSNLTEHFGASTLRMRMADQIESIEQYGLQRSRRGCDRGSGVTLNLRRLRIFFFVAWAVCGVMFVVNLVNPSIRREKAGKETKEDEGIDGAEEKGWSIKKEMSYDQFDLDCTDAVPSEANL